MTTTTLKHNLIPIAESVRNEWTQDINEWLAQFELALNGWETWLTRVEQAMVLGQFETLAALEDEGQPVHLAIQNATDQRAKLIQQSENVFPKCRGISDLVQFLFPAKSPQSQQLAQISQQLRRVKTISTSLFVTCLQSIQYTQSMIQLISTGSPYSATYGQCEFEAHSSGHIVDTAA